MNLYTDADYTRRSSHEHGKPDDPRSAFHRDYARVLHSPAFRRLQGKMQLFPALESDFFRNRLTHSLEVAQIGKALTRKLNQDNEFLQREPIDSDLVEAAALAHDFGHPPFAHSGEEQLDELMKDNGGFEGNAQTIRILSRLEKKNRTDTETRLPFDSAGNDKRLGLDLTYRTYAAVLKKERQVPSHRERDKEKVKGYYSPEHELIQEMRRHVIGDSNDALQRTLYTLECSIMDLADDIAYSTYDLEDALKGGLVNPLDFFQADRETLGAVATKVEETLSTNPDCKNDPPSFTSDDVLQTLAEIFGSVAREGEEPDQPPEDQESRTRFWISATSDVYRAARDLGTSGYLRADFTSRLVHQFVTAVDLDDDNTFPPLSQAYLPKEELVLVEVLKHMTYHLITCSPRLRVTQYRGKNIVEDIYKSLNNEADSGSALLPEDFRAMHDIMAETGVGGEKRRVICDFIAGMTDRYAVEYFGRLKSENPQTIFHPF